MVYRGHVKNGVVVLDESTSLPEGAEVRVEVVETEAGGQPTGEPSGATLYERYKSVIGKATGLPADASQNVDHYLYGHPKK